LLEACNLVWFYEEIGRSLTVSNISYDPVIRNYAQQWKALKERKEGDAPKLPKITKALPIIHWAEAFVDYLNRKIGARTIPLSYVIRESAIRPAVCPPLATDLPHSAEH